MQIILSYDTRRQCVEGMYCDYEVEERLAARLAVKYPRVIYFFASITDNSLSLDEVPTEVRRVCGRELLTRLKAAVDAAEVNTTADIQSLLDWTLEALEEWE
jgi:hypothetical protein